MKKKVYPPSPWGFWENRVLFFLFFLNHKKIKIIFFSFFWVPSNRKSCEDHESPVIWGSTTNIFWVIAVLRLIFSDLENFFETQILKIWFSTYFFFILCVFSWRFQWNKHRLSKRLIFSKLFLVFRYLAWNRSEKLNEGKGYFKLQITAVFRSNASQKHSICHKKVQIFAKII